MSVRARKFIKTRQVETYLSTKHAISNEFDQDQSIY
jgi:hypothetical protein